MASVMFSVFQQCLPTSSNSAIMVTYLHQLYFLTVSYSLQPHWSLWECGTMSTAVFSELLSVCSELLTRVEIKPIFCSLKTEYVTYNFSHWKSWTVARSWLSFFNSRRQSQFCQHFW